MTGLRILNSDSVWRVSAVGLVVSFVTFVVLFLIPGAVARLDELQAWSDKRKRLAITMNRLGDVAQARVSLEAMDAYVFGLSSPSHGHSVTDRLGFIQEEAQRFGLVQLELRPGRTDSSGALLQTPVYLQLLGRYTSVGRFVAAMENGPVPIRAESIAATATGMNTHSISVGIQLHMMADSVHRSSN